jgi:2-polyprenyl-3-methyl-5-hydroxy-6-metoxy-1,4-benzoquinol methylase
VLADAADGRLRGGVRKTELYFDSISDDFEDRMNAFDLEARLAWFDRSLRAHQAAGRMLVDVGAGLGQFSDVARRHGARVVPVDIAGTLVTRLQRRFSAATRASATSLPFPSGSVDFVVSSECVEHTSDPRAAIREMLRVLKPGGLLFVTTPNLVWRWSVGLAEILRIRQFEGLENWLSRPAVRRAIVAGGGEIVESSGLHILPFQFTPLLPLIRLTNDRGQWLKPLMINQCWVARRTASA